MSTRATYEFRAENSPTVTLYVHHDGYPTGAASYFYDTLTAGHDGGLAEQFIRAVPRAEITASHAANGDTQYRYTVEGRGAGASIKVEGPSGAALYFGTLAEFLDRNRPAFGTGAEEYHPFLPVVLPYSKSSTWYNRPLALAEVTERKTPSGRLRSSNLATLRIWKANGHGPGSANFQSVSARVHTIATAFGLGEILAELQTLSLSQ